MAFWKQSPPKPDAPQLPTRPSTAAPAVSIAERSLKDKSKLALLDEDDLALARKGFDPYNSGAFDFRHTWEKVNRKK